MMKFITTPFRWKTFSNVAVISGWNWRWNKTSLSSAPVWEVVNVKTFPKATQPLHNSSFFFEVSTLSTCFVLFPLLFLFYLSILLFNWFSILFGRPKPNMFALNRCWFSHTTRVDLINGRLGRLWLNVKKARSLLITFIHAIFESFDFTA